MGGSDESLKEAEEPKRQASDEALVVLEEDKAEFDREHAEKKTIEVDVHVRNAHKTRSAALKMKCTDLENFAIRPPTGILAPGASLKVQVKRKPHKAARDHKLEVHYLVYKGSDPEPSPADINKLFKKKGKEEKEVLTCVLRMPRPARKAKPDKADKTEREVESRRRPTKDRAPKEKLQGKSNSKAQAHAKAESRRASPERAGSGDRKRASGDPASLAKDKEKEKDKGGRGGRKPLALELEEPDTRCIFFPPWTEAKEMQVTVRNPAKNPRVAVKMKCSDLDTYEIRPTYAMLKAGEREEVVVRRKGTKAEVKTAKPELLAIYCVKVADGETEWKKAWEGVPKAEQAELKINLELREVPLLEAAQTEVLFLRPIAVHSMAVLSLRNVSPFHAWAKCLCGDNRTFRVSPVRSLLGPEQTKPITLSLAKPTLARTKVQIQYCLAGEEEREEYASAEKKGKGAEALRRLADEALKGGGERVMELDAWLARDPEDRLALAISPQVAELQPPSPQPSPQPDKDGDKDGRAPSKSPPSLSASIQLHNRSSAHLALKLLAMKPEAFRINLTKLMMEPDERRELRVSPRGSAAQANSAMRVELAFAPPNSRPDQLIRDAKAKDPASVAALRIPILFPDPHPKPDHDDVTGPDHTLR